MRAEVRIINRTVALQTLGGGGGGGRKGGRGGSGTGH